LDGFSQINGVTINGLAIDVRVAGVAGAAGKNNISRLLYFLFCYCENVSG
jgi:hypothetical protein